VLVTGAGPIGLLAALLSVQRGFDTHVLDRVTEGRKPDMVAALGATYHAGDAGDLGADVVIECTGYPEVLLKAGEHVPNRITCLTGVSSTGSETPMDLGYLNRRMVLHNGVIFGSVNANRRHYELAAAALAQADRQWLDRLITRRVPLDHWSEAYTRQPDDIKATLQFA
jgi:threonine dehydrogenase-like Zn-dependent dehydrogenase